MTISLPTNPNGEQFEDLVVSALLTMGNFVESNMILSSDGKEILELDVVATPNGAREEERILYEVKKQGFNFSNTFKLYGQMCHLGIRDGCLVSMKGASKEHLPIYESKGKELGISMCTFSLDGEMFELTSLCDENNGLPLEEKEKVVFSLWYLNIARRIALTKLRQQCRIHKDIEEFKDAKKYLFATRSSFFEKTALGRAESLYKAYLDHPKLSGALVKFWAEQKSEDEEKIWKQARDSHEYLDVQCVMDLESLARCSILKNALDDFSARGKAPPPSAEIRIGEYSFEIPKHDLPQSYYEGLRILTEHPYGDKIPYLFQVFYLMFGGFIYFKDTDELNLLSVITDIPAKNIVECLELLNNFFGNFFWTNRYDMMCMKGVPGITRGGGCFFRQTIFDLENYADKYSDSAWLLSMWHNAAYHALEPSLKKAS